LDLNASDEETRVGAIQDSDSPGRELTIADPDREDALRAVSGDESAFEALVERHQNRIYTWIYFMVFDQQIAEDLAQEAFLRAFTGLKTFRFEAKFGTWLTRIATNVTLHHFERGRAQKRSGRTISIDASRDSADSSGPMEIPDRTHLPEEWAMRNERQRAILDAVSALPEDYRSALALRELSHRSYQEIAEDLGLPIGTVKSKIFRARQILQDRLKDVL